MFNIRDLVGLYIDEQLSILRSFPDETVAQFCDLIIKTYEAGGTVYVAANGGPAGFCDNFACDLLFHPFVSDDKTKPLPDEVKRMSVVNLASSTAVLTGAMNDLGPSFIFSSQLEGHIKENDLFVGFSGSGNSGNILEAIAVAKKHGAQTAVISRGTGGKCKEVADLSIIIPGTSTFPGQVGKNDNNFHFEDACVSITHMAVGILQKHVREKHGIKS